MYLLKFIILISFCYSKVATDCNFSFETDFPENAPLIFETDDENLVNPVKDGAFQGVRLKEGNEVDLVCVGEGNDFETLSNINDPKLKRPQTCSEGTLKGPDGVPRPLKQFKCQKPDLNSPQFTESTYEPISNPSSCGKDNEGKLYQIFCGGDENIKKNLIQVCFSKSKSISYYSHHEISGENVPVKDKDSTKDFKVGTGFYLDNPDKYYTLENLKETLKNLFNDLSQDILNKNVELNRGHLAPARDFAYFRTLRKATFYHINAVPQWQKLNCGVWKSVETAVRSYAFVTRSRSVDVYTGFFEVLTILKKDNTPVPIYLGPNNQLPVPKFIWKIVQDKENGNRGIVFILYNDLYQSNVLSDKDWPCDNLLDCKSFDWPIQSSPESGLVKCCDVIDFKNKIKYAGISKMDVSGILAGVDIVEDALDVFCDDCEESSQCNCCAGCIDGFCDLEDKENYNFFDNL